MKNIGLILIGLFFLSSCDNFGSEECSEPGEWIDGQKLYDLSDGEKKGICTNVMVSKEEYTSRDSLNIESTVQIITITHAQFSIVTLYGDENDFKSGTEYNFDLDATNKRNNLVVAFFAQTYDYNPVYLTPKSATFSIANFDNKTNTISGILTYSYITSNNRKTQIRSVEFDNYKI